MAPVGPATLVGAAMATTASLFGVPMVYKSISTAKSTATGEGVGVAPIMRHWEHGLDQVRFAFAEEWGHGLEQMHVVAEPVSANYGFNAIFDVITHPAMMFVLADLTILWSLTSCHRRFSKKSAHAGLLSVFAAVVFAGIFSYILWIPFEAISSTPFTFTATPLNRRKLLDAARNFDWILSTPFSVSEAMSHPVMMFVLLALMIPWSVTSLCCRRRLKKDVHASFKSFAEACPQHSGESGRVNLSKRDDSVVVSQDEVEHNEQGESAAQRCLREL